MLLLEQPFWNSDRGPIASEGDEVGEGVGRHRNDEEERELYLRVLLQKWRKPQVNDAGWAV